MDVPEPDLFTYFEVTSTKKKTKPGPDGLPYSAFGNRRSADTLLGADKEMRTGVSPPFDFNYSDSYFAPKGDEEEDVHQVIREPLSTRPLSMKNCDNKQIMSANVKVLEPRYKVVTNRAQNGFVGGRNFLTNIVDIDSAGRIYSNKYHGSNERIRERVNNIPISAAYDFAAAFPSVIHAWIWLVLRHRKLPESFITLFMAAYRNACAVYNHNGVVHIIIHFLSGVLQGCPASALLFNNALDPVLTWFSQVLGDGVRGLFRACADDLAFTLSRLKHLGLIHPVYAAAEQFAGLSLKPKNV